MYSLISSGGKTIYNIKELICENIDDLKTLPACDMGSTVIVLNPELKVFIKGANHQWVEVDQGKPTNGKSAYEIAQENGFTGSVTEWLESLKGLSPHIGEDGNWYIGEKNTGVTAKIEIQAITPDELLEILEEDN